MLWSKLCALKHLTLLAGTGYTLNFKEDSIGTGVGKLTGCSQFTSFAGFTTPDSLLAYAKQAVLLSQEDEEDLKRVHTMLIGRCRLFAAVVEFMIANTMTLRAAGTLVVSGLSSRRGIPEMKLSISDMISWLSGERAIVNGLTMMGLVETAAVQYFCTGKGFSVTGNWDACIALVEAGIGRLEVCKNQCYTVELDEYITLAAARNYFEDAFEGPGRSRSAYLTSKWLEICSRVPYPSAQGLCVQTLYALSFQSMWEGVMRSMPLMKPLLELDDCPVMFKWMASKAGVLMKGMMDVYVSNDSWFIFIDDDNVGYLLGGEAAMEYLAGMKAGAGNCKRRKI